MILYKLLMMNNRNHRNKREMLRKINKKIKIFPINNGYKNLKNYNNLFKKIINIHNLIKFSMNKKKL